MKKSANEIIKERLEEVLYKNETQRAATIGFLNIAKNNVDKNIQLFEDLVYLIEKQNIQYNLLQEIKNYIKSNQIKDINEVISTLKDLETIENITSLLTDKLEIFVYLTLIMNLDSNLLSFVLKKDFNKTKDNLFNMILEDNRKIKENIDNKQKNLIRKKGENNE